MAKVKIQGHASGTGVITVTAPNTSTDRTITLPDSTGELLSTAGGTMTGDLTLNGADIVKSGSADLTIDSGGRIDLSADDNGEIRLWDGSSKYAQFKDDDDRLKIQSMIQDKDIMFVGNDGGSEVTAMKLDMSEGGLAICYGGVAIGGAGTANTLDDYEEGTWTPAFSNGMGASNQNGKYIKIGGVVHLHASLKRSASSAASTSMVIIGLPFTSDDTTINVAGSFWLDNGSGSDKFGYGAYAASDGIRGLQSTSTRYFRYNDVNNNKSVYLYVCYRTTA
jgi:hypothetical protein